MSERRSAGVPVRSSTRRRMVAALGFSFGGLVLTGRASRAEQSAPEVHADPANKTLTTLHQEYELRCSAHGVYEALLDAKQFAAFSHMPAEIHREAGGAFQMFGGMIEGRNVELVPDQRIVQAWRPTHWDAGVYSMVKFELKEKGGRTNVVLDHTGFPAGDFNSLSEGWKSHYWQPMGKFFG